MNFELSIGPGPGSLRGTDVARLSDLTHYPPLWSTAGLPGGPMTDQPAGVLPFSKIDWLSDLQALRLHPPPLGEPWRERAQQDEKTSGPFLERRRVSRLDALALSRLVPVPAAGDRGADK